MTIGDMWPEVGKVTLKSNGDEALNDEFLLKRNGDEALNAKLGTKAMKRWDEALNASSLHFFWQC